MMVNPLNYPSVDQSYTMPVTQSPPIGRFEILKPRSPLLQQYAEPHPSKKATAQRNGTSFPMVIVPYETW
jgi:hypothetical protein